MINSLNNCANNSEKCACNSIVQNCKSGIFRNSKFSKRITLKRKDVESNLPYSNKTELISDRKDEYSTKKNKFVDIYMDYGSVNDFLCTKIVIKDFFVEDLKTNLLQKLKGLYKNSLNETITKNRNEIDISINDACSSGEVKHKPQKIYTILKENKRNTTIIDTYDLKISSDYDNDRDILDEVENNNDEIFDNYIDPHLSNDRTNYPIKRFYRNKMF